MATLRETRGWRLTPWLLLACALFACAMAAAKAWRIEFVGGLSWWLVVGMAAAAFLAALGGLEICTDFRGPLVSLARDLQGIWRRAGRCERCGGQSVWVYPPDTRFLPRDARPSCPSCEERKFDGDPAPPALDRREHPLQRRIETPLRPGPEGRTAGGPAA